MGSKRGPFRRARRLVVRLAALALALAIGWVGLYRVADPPTTWLIEAERRRLGQVAQDWRDFDAISPHLARAVIAAEDARFCEHGGLDLEAIRTALAERIERGRVRGASTISQQTAKNAFLWPAASWTRKALELPFTLLMEAFWPKRRILEVYLNLAEWGPGVFGAEAAARRWFGKSADALTLAEASRLAAILPNPKARSATRPSPFVAGRARAAAAGAETLRSQDRDACLRG